MKAPLRRVGDLPRAAMLAVVLLGAVPCALRADDRDFFGSRIYYRVVTIRVIINKGDTYPNFEEELSAFRTKVKGRMVNLASIAIDDKEETREMVEKVLPLLDDPERKEKVEPISVKLERKPDPPAPAPHPTPDPPRFEGSLLAWVGIPFAASAGFNVFLMLFLLFGRVRDGGASISDHPRDFGMSHSANGTLPAESEIVRRLADARSEVARQLANLDHADLATFTRQILDAYQRHGVAAPFQERIEVKARLFVVDCHGRNNPILIEELECCWKQIKNHKTRLNYHRTRESQGGQGLDASAIGIEIKNLNEELAKEYGDLRVKLPKVIRRIAADHPAPAA